MSNEILNDSRGNYDALAEPPVEISLGHVVDFDASGQTACIVHKLTDENELFCWNLNDDSNSTDLTENIPSINNPQSIELVDSFHLIVS